ncbi:MAG: 5'/3'-nucleotidase SurE [Desulfobacterales bacterium]|nr:MAG: 5'/3'-nucleotidase SurE [Desulfobacterales bacterium]
MKILITNDDGYRAPGIQALYRELSRVHQVTLVAPDQEKSAVGHGITANSPLKYERVDLNCGGSGYAVSGTPADCVKLALFDLFQDAPPDMIVSGINAGSNTGINLNYSGTVGAAREGTLNGITAIAVSIQYGDVMDFDGTAAYVASMVETAFNMSLPPGVFLNINIPCIPIKNTLGVKVTRQADNNLAVKFDRRTNPRGRTYFWYDEMHPVRPEDNTDNDALLANCISITPIQCDMTAYTVIDALENAGF